MVEFSLEIKGKWQTGSHLALKLLKRRKGPPNFWIKSPRKLGRSLKRADLPASLHGCSSLSLVPGAFAPEGEGREQAQPPMPLWSSIPVSRKGHHSSSSSVFSPLKEELEPCWGLPLWPFQRPVQRGLAPGVNECNAQGRQIWWAYPCPLHIWAGILDFETWEIHRIGYNHTPCPGWLFWTSALDQRGPVVTGNGMRIK